MKPSFWSLAFVVSLFLACKNDPPPVSVDTPVIDAEHPMAYYRSDSTFYSVYQPDDNFYDLIIQSYRTPNATGLPLQPAQTRYFKRTDGAYVDYFGDSTGLLLPAPLAREQSVRGDLAGEVIELTPIDPAVPITWLSFSDSARYDTSADAAYYERAYRLARAASDNETLNALINADMRSHALGDAASRAGGDLLNQLATVSAAAKKEFLAQDVPEDNLPYGAAYSRSNSEKGQVRYNHANLLTLEMVGYYYEGGAHGNYGSSFYSYQVDPPKRLGLSDYVASSQHAALGAVLTRRANLMDEAGNKISDRFYETNDAVSVTNNVAVFPDGLLFYYPPYELGPYAAGAIEIFVPLAELPR